MPTELLNWAEITHEFDWPIFFFNPISFEITHVVLFRVPLSASTVVGSTSQHFRVPPLEIILAVD
jgi:hypothetical protein